MYRLWCRMAEGLYTDEEDEAEASPAASGAYSHSSDTDAHENHRPPTQPQPQPKPQVGQGPPEPRRQDATASKDLEQEIAQALAADAAFLEDPSMSLREGALQPLEAGLEEGAYELPALSAGGTISKVSHPLGAVSHLPLPPRPPSEFLSCSVCYEEPLPARSCKQVLHPAGTSVRLFQVLALAACHLIGAAGWSEARHVMPCRMCWIWCEGWTKTPSPAC